MARSFNGSSDFISLGTSNTLNLTGPATLSVWVYPTSFNNYGTVYDRPNGATHQMGIFVESTGKIGWYWDDQAGHGVDPGSHTLSLNTWYNLISVNSASLVGTGYVNGLSDGTAGGANTNNSPGLTSYIGQDGGNGGIFFPGRIADLALWNVALTAGEISALANGALPYTIRPSALVGYWPLNGLQSPEPDLSGKANNGTLTGTATAAGPSVMQFTPRWPLNSLASATSSSTGASFLAAWALGQRMFGDGIGV